MTQNTPTHQSKLPVRVDFRHAWERIPARIWLSCSRTDAIAFGMPPEWTDGAIRFEGQRFGKRFLKDIDIRGEVIWTPASDRVTLEVACADAPRWLSQVLAAHGVQPDAPVDMKLMLRAHMRCRTHAVCRDPEDPPAYDAFLEVAFGIAAAA